MKSKNRKYSSEFAYKLISNSKKSLTSQQGQGENPSYSSKILGFTKTKPQNLSNIIRMPEASPESRPPTVRLFDMRNDFSNVVSINRLLDTIPTSIFVKSCRLHIIPHILIQILFTLKANSWNIKTTDLEKEKKRLKWLPLLSALAPMAKGTEISFAFFSTIQQNYQQSRPKIQGGHIVEGLENLSAKEETQMIWIVS